jgi:peptidoglycan hydrolase-like protein with peptidoglycan-binding domain
MFLLIAASLLVASSALAQGSTAPATKSATSDSSTTSQRPPVFRPTKDQISQVQTILKNKKLYNGESTGKYDDDTRAGIKSFQKDNGLRETGTLNRATLEKFGVTLTDSQKLIPVSPNSYAAPEEKPATAAATTKSETKMETSTASSEKTAARTIFRATSDQIKAAQKLLKSGSMYSGDETGKLDDATRDGLKKYQDANGLKVTGTLNQATLDKMGIQLTDKQKADAAATDPK